MKTVRDVDDADVAIQNRRRRSGIIAQRGRRVTVLDPMRLEALARGDTRLGRRA